MEQCDPLIRGGCVATAAINMMRDVGGLDGRIVAFVDRLDTARQTFDARGLLVMSGGILPYLAQRDQFVTQFLISI